MATGGLRRPVVHYRPAQQANMPFVEIIIPPRQSMDRAAVANRVTAALVRAFGISREIVSIYFIDIGADGYAHAGSIEAAEQRLFVKVHAFRRVAEQRRRAAAAITTEIVTICNIPAQNIAVYFLEREPDEVAHAGRLASDSIQ